LPYGHTIDSFVDDICVDAWKNFRMFNHPHNYLISDVGLERFYEFSCFLMLNDSFYCKT